MFSQFQKAITQQIDYILSQSDLFVVDISREKLWETYINSFSAGTDPIYKEATEHTCNCCKSFIKQMGAVVGIIDNKIVSIWSIDGTTVPQKYVTVAKKLSELVESSRVNNIFVHESKSCGTKKSYLTDGSGVEFDHFYYETIPNKSVRGISRDTYRGNIAGHQQVIQRSLNELTLESVDTLWNLIEEGNLYRGEQYKKQLSEFRSSLITVETQGWNYDLYAWRLAFSGDLSARIRNTAIGTILIDLSNDVDLETAVKKYEKVTAPTNYKRPKALVTKKMIKEAQDTVESLGFTNSLGRRYAKVEDINVNDVLWVDRNVRKKMQNPFDELIFDVKVSSSNTAKYNELSANDFIEKVLPNTKELEILFDNKHQNNLTSLIAPLNLEAPSMFQWNNGFSWSYNGEVTDSIKEKVTKAGGKLGYLRCSLEWFNYDDLDIHIWEPNKEHIYFRNKRSYSSGGVLDIDMNAGRGRTREPVENITWENPNTIQEGKYILKVHNFAKRKFYDVGFNVQIECNGKIWNFTHNGDVSNKKYITVAEFTYENGEIKIENSIPSQESSKKIWGIDSMKFHKVSTVIFSPNYWGENKVGHKHFMFFIQNCTNSEVTRGFYNEFLHSDLVKHRKVFERLAEKMKVEHSISQLSGLGFTSARKDSVLVKVDGKPLKINF